MIGCADRVTFPSQGVGRRLFGYITLAFVLFPFLPRLIDTDLQPWYLVALSVYLLLNFKVRHSSSWLIFLVISLIIIIYRLRFQYGVYDALRAVPVYLTPPLLLFFLKDWQCPRKKLSVILDFALCGYFFFALAQALGLDPFQFNSEIRSAAGRGVRSLSPEPSMFGFLATLLFASRLSLGNASLVSVVIYISCILLSASAAAIITSIPLILYLSLRYIGRSFVLVMLLLFLSPFYLGALIDSTPSRLFDLINNAGFSLVASDASINERVGHLVFIFGSAHHYLIGGLDGWGDEYLQFLWETPFFFYGSGVNNILSGIGAVVFDGGFLGFVWIGCLLWVCGVARHPSLPRTIFLGISVLSVAIQSVSFAVPLLTLAIYCVFSSMDISDYITSRARVIKCES